MPTLQEGGLAKTGKNKSGKNQNRVYNTYMRILMLYSGLSIGVKNYTEQLINTNTSTEYIKQYVGNERRMLKYDADTVVNMYHNQVTDDVDGVHIQYDSAMFKGDGDEWDQLENFTKYLELVKDKHVCITFHGYMFNEPNTYKLSRYNIMYKCLKRYWLKEVIPAINKHTVIVHCQQHADQMKTQGVSNPIVQLPQMVNHVPDLLPSCCSDKLKVIMNPGRHTDRECVDTVCEIYKQLMNNNRYELYMNVSIPTWQIAPELDDHVHFVDFDERCHSTYIEQLKQFDVAIVAYKTGRAAPFSGVIWDCIGSGLVTLTINSCYDYMCPVVESWKLDRALNRLVSSTTTREYNINKKYKDIYAHTKKHVDKLYVKIYSKTDDHTNIVYDDDNHQVEISMQNNMTGCQFGRTFLTFTKLLDVSNEIYSEQKLDDFCKLMNIKYNDRYKKLTGDLNLMHSYVCYLMTEMITDKTSDIHVPIESDSAVVIPEDRILPHLEYHIRNAMLLTPDHTIKVVCTTPKLSSMKDFCSKIHKNIHVLDSGIDKFTQNTYNDMLLNQDFWSCFKEEYILIYQQDAIMFRSGVDAFKKYDYVGAPWPSDNNDNKLGVGNGGFSLRRKSKMIECLQTVKPHELNLGKNTEIYMDDRGLLNPPEDVYYSKVMIDNDIGVVAPRPIASKFSQEHVISQNPLGGHQYWLADEHIDTVSRKNILVIDDKIPSKSEGQGLARAQEMIQSLAASFNVTLFPTNQTTDTCDERISFYKSIGVQMQIRLRDKHGENVLTMLGDYIKDNADRYDIILVSRPHNLQHIINHVKNNVPLHKIVYDAEALFYERAFRKHKLTGDPSYKQCEQQKQQELDLLSITNKKIVVSKHEKDKVIKLTNSTANDVHVYGHAINIMSSGKDFQQREGLFFLGAFVHDDTPNTDAVIHLVKDILPIVQEHVKCKLYIGGYEPTKQVIDLGDDNIKVLGFIDNPIEYYKSCRLFVSPHRVAAGIPWKISEAMANGLPVVGSSLMLEQMCVDESIMRGSSDPEGIAADIIDLYTNETKWTTTRNNAIEHISKTHNPEIINTNLTKYLNGI